ncbi:MAG: hypothetical protein JW934_14355 [Anaerolineae bacterium]|nr:hypothetical protein [Anaerolineae bacterium]
MRDRSRVYQSFLVVGGAIGLGLCVILAFDIGGWGAFALDIGQSLFVQAMIAFFLFGLFLLVCAPFRSPLRLLASRTWRSAGFALAATASMFLPPLLFGRLVDWYDAVQTLLGIGLFYWLTLRAEPRIKQALDASKPKSFFSSWQLDPAARERRAQTRTHPGVAYPELYRNLLVKVHGDHAAAQRLIEFERKRHPNASQADLIRRAIERWELDNR